MQKITILEEDENGNLCLNLDDETLNAVGWKIGDTITWTDNKDGTFTLMKKKTKYVLVDAIQTFRMRYVVELNESDPSEYAADTVVMNEATEFSQKFLDEQILDFRDISHDEMIALCDRDNDYAKSWDESQKVKVFVTSLEDQDE